MNETASTTGSDAASSRPSGEKLRLIEHRQGLKDWKRWGPYVSDRAWGTVREDYSADGAAWDYLPHDHARSTAYRWGEDGLAGICDRDQHLCLAVALWNGRDAILKERLFGLGGPEGPHGEDVKELYYHLDSTPTHAYMKFLYKYPQDAYPYGDLVGTNRRRGREEPEYELVDTGVFDDSRYFDVFVEYAKATPEEIFLCITAFNRGPQEAVLHVIPQVWFRRCGDNSTPPVPLIDVPFVSASEVRLSLEHPVLGRRFLVAEGPCEPLLTDNETNARRFDDTAAARHAKDAFHEYIVHGRRDAVNPHRRGTKAGLHRTMTIDPGGSQRMWLWLGDRSAPQTLAAGEAVMHDRIREADAFYESIHDENMTEDERLVQRQALAGMLWSKQFYMFDVRRWLDGDESAGSPPPQRRAVRNGDWQHLSVADVISMPDKWEYPWFAAWDWSFHAIPIAIVDADEAKAQLELLLSEKLQHPNGQLPAFEWQFDDVNPPVQAWAVWRVYNMDKHAHGEQGDRAFLERCYHKLLLNFTWWVNRKDSQGNNVFQGGFLGLDNISVFDRSHPLPGGAELEQADATGWMGLFALNMMAIGLELAQHDSVYEHLGIKFFEHFLAISTAINGRLQPDLSMWDETDGWYYDVVYGQDGRSTPLKVRSLVGLIPMFAAMVLDHNWFKDLPNFKARYEWILTNRPDLGGGLACVWAPDGARCLMSIVNHDRLQRILARTLDTEEFLAPHGVRALSRYHLEHPYTLTIGDHESTVRYEPAESTTSMFGGNSNWRGPVWYPTNFMLITALRVYDRFFGPGFKVECPTGSGRWMTLNEVALEIGRRLCDIFLKDGDGRRPAFGDCELFNRDAHFRDRLLFHEYFHGEDGRGLGASHQTGWTGLVAKLLDQQAVGRRGADGAGR